MKYNYIFIITSALISTKYYICIFLLYLKPG